MCTFPLIYTYLLIAFLVTDFCLLVALVMYAHQMVNQKEAGVLSQMCWLRWVSLSLHSAQTFFCLFQAMCLQEYFSFTAELSGQSRPVWTACATWWSGFGCIHHVLCAVEATRWYRSFPEELLLQKDWHERDGRQHGQSGWVGSSERNEEHQGIFAENRTDNI